MISPAIWALAATAASIGIVHTLSGPDHYLPLVAVSRARRWPLRRALRFTVLAGTSHLAGSLILGLLGVALGVAVRQLEIVESVRGDLAAGLLIALGLVYTAWGVRRALLVGPHGHWHRHADGTVHSHRHSHRNRHAHSHPSDGRVTLYGLFAIFALGSCEPLIPMLMYPAARLSWLGMVLVTVVYAAGTLGAMLLGVLAGLYGARLFRIAALERWAHAVAGGTMAACGLVIFAFGW